MNITIKHNNYYYLKIPKNVNEIDLITTRTKKIVRNQRNKIIIPRSASPMDRDKNYF